MESLSDKGKRCFTHENNKFRSYRKDQQGNEYWRFTINRRSASEDIDSRQVELISNHAHDDTVQNEAVQILRTACKEKGRPAMHVNNNVRPQLSELFCQSKPNLISP